MHLIIATRESPLALWQANWVKSQLEMLHPGIKVSLLGITTQADKLLDIPLTKVGGKGLFVKELEQALLDEKAHIAVHSMKDVPMALPDGLCLPVMSKREDPRDVFLSDKYQSLDQMPAHAVLGTSSLRRQSQLYALRSDLNIVHLRGNINTRIMRLDRGEFDAIILAAAGLQRMGFMLRNHQILTTEEMLPAAGQGVLGIECRIDDKTTQDLIAPLHHAESAACVIAERAVCRALGGGCHMPVAAFAEIEANRLFLRGRIGKPDGSLILESEFSDSLINPELIGTQVATGLIEQGAEEILACIKK